MCGRAYETYSDEELNIRYLNQRFPPIPDFLPTYNLCPTHSSPVLRLLDGERKFDSMQWQLIPDWEPTFKTKLSTINARSESVFGSRLFGELISRKRCIVPLSGFFEWKPDGKIKRPFRIFLKDEPIMSVAGLWETWHAGREGERSSFTILTTKANSFMSGIHDRMPVILGRDEEDEWLDPEIHEQEPLTRMMKPCPSEWLTALEVSTLVNSPKNNSPEILVPASAAPAAKQPLMRSLFDEEAL